MSAPIVRLKELVGEHYRPWQNEEAKRDRANGHF